MLSIRFTHMSAHLLHLNTTPRDHTVKVGISHRPIPVEIVDMICSITSRKGLLNILRANKQYHAIAARILYRRVSVHGLDARRFFLTILSPTVHSRMYAQFVTDFTYEGNRKEDQYLTSNLFVDSLLYLNRLQHLHIIMDEVYSSTFLASLYKKEIIREYKTIFEELRDNIKNAGCLLTLPCLRSLTINGDPRLASIARCRSLESIVLVKPLDLSTLSSVINHIRYPNQHAIHHLRFLKLHFQPFSLRVLTLVFRGLAELFPNVSHIHLCMPSANPLVRIYQLAVGDTTVYLPLCHRQLVTLWRTVHSALQSSNL